MLRFHLHTKSLFLWEHSSIQKQRMHWHYLVCTFLASRGVQEINISIPHFIKAETKILLDEVLKYEVHFFAAFRIILSVWKLRGVSAEALREKKTSVLKNHIWDVQDLKENTASHQAQKGKLNHHQASPSREQARAQNSFVYVRLQGLGKGLST